MCDAPLSSSSELSSSMIQQDRTAKLPWLNPLRIFHWLCLLRWSRGAGFVCELKQGVVILFFCTCADAVRPWSHVVHHQTSRFWVNVVLNRDAGAQHVDSLFCCSCEYFKQMKSTWPIYFLFCHIQSWHISNDFVRWAVLRWKAASCYGSLSLQEVLDLGVRL